MCLSSGYKRLITTVGCGLNNCLVTLSSGYKRLITTVGCGLNRSSVRLISAFALRICATARADASSLRTHSHTQGLKAPLNGCSADASGTESEPDVTPSAASMPLASVCQCGHDRYARKRTPKAARRH